MVSPTSPEYVDMIVRAAVRDPRIVSVLRQICALETTVRASALDLLAIHLANRGAAQDVLDCVAALRHEDVARRIAEALPATG